MGRKNGKYVSIASFIFLKKYKQKHKTDSTGVIFNKFLTLLHRQLKNENMDIALPHCWYRWGDEVVKYYFPYIGWTHDDLDKTKVTFEAEAPDIDENDETVIRINEFAEEFLEKYDNTQEGVEKAIDEVYSEAPFEFQNKFRKLREGLKISKKHVGYSNFDSYVLDLFNDAMESFPKEFSSMKREKTEFQEVFRNSVANKVSRKNLFDLTELFWFYFCYHLRVNKKCHENVDGSTIRIWKNTISDEMDHFEISLQNYAFLLCKNSDNTTIKNILKERKNRLENLDELLDRLAW